MSARTFPSVFDALPALRDQRRDYRSIARRSQETPDSLATFLLPVARGVYLRKRAVAMQPVVLP